MCKQNTKWQNQVVSGLFTRSEALANLYFEKLHHSMFLYRYEMDKYWLFSYLYAEVHQLKPTAPRRHCSHQLLAQLYHQNHAKIKGDRGAEGHGCHTGSATVDRDVAGQLAPNGNETGRSTTAK